MTALRVRGRETVRISPAEFRRLPHETQTRTIECSSGSAYDADFTGVPLDAVLSRVDPPDETTHLAVTAADDCLVYVTVDAALTALLADERDGEALDGYRLVGPAIGGTRSVKDVVAVAAASLDPGTDPTTLERHPEIDPD